MNKIKLIFDKNHPLFIPFFVAGHPTLDSTVTTITSLSKAGADIIELGIPFSDPIADGPVNQNASEIALKNGASLNWCLEQVNQARLQKCETPIVLFSYLNPILAMGIENFSKKAKTCGVNGVLIVDLPPEAGEDIYHSLTNAGLEIILLVSPTTNHERLKLYKQLHPSFIYYISRLGVTGTQNKLTDNLAQEVHNLRNYFKDIPIAVGFGISTPEQAQRVAEISDGVIVGSLLVNELEKSGLSATESLASKLNQAIKK